MPDLTMQISEFDNSVSLSTQMKNMSVSDKIASNPILTILTSSERNSNCLSAVHTKQVEEKYKKSFKFQTNVHFKYSLKNEQKKEAAKQLEKPKFVKKRFMQPDPNLCNIPPLSLNMHLDKIDGI